MKKKAEQLLKKFQKVRGLSQEEKILFARSLAATPDERWEMNEAHRRFLLSFKPSRKTKSVTS